MARKIEYSKSSALTQATKLFLRKGYEATPMDELVKATGINRHSMYKEFGDKERLFLACIKHYTLEQRNLKTVEILTQKPLGIKNVEAFLQDRVDYALCDDCYGCLLVNTVIEREVVSQKINDKIDRILANQENLIFKCIEAAIEGGQISKDNDSRLVTDYLSCFFRGLMNMAKNPNKNKCSLKKMGFMALTSIER
jgi:TetR/AcrR family transcriptional repressor of nem operon